MFESIGKLTQLQSKTNKQTKKKKSEMCFLGTCPRYKERLSLPYDWFLLNKKTLPAAEEPVRLLFNIRGLHQINRATTISSALLNPQNLFLWTGVQFRSNKGPLQTKGALWSSSFPVVAPWSLPWTFARVWIQREKEADIELLDVLGQFQEECSEGSFISNVNMFL